MNRVPVAPVRLNQDVPPELERIINKTLDFGAHGAEGHKDRPLGSLA